MVVIEVSEAGAPHTQNRCGRIPAEPRSRAGSSLSGRIWLGSARPMLAAIRRCGSFVEFSLITVKATCPGLMCFKPSLREINLQFGGKIEDTRTMLHAAMPALRKASSKLDSRSRCLRSEEAEKVSRCGKVTRRISSVNAKPDRNLELTRR